MKTSKRMSFRIVLALVLIMSLLAGCSSSKNNNKNQGSPSTASAPNSSSPADTAAESSEPAKEVTLKILFPGDPPKDLDAVNDAIAKKLKADGLNFKLDYTWAPWDTYWNKQSLVVAGGEGFDLTWSHISNLPQSVAKTVLMPIDEFLESDGQQLKESTPDYMWKGVQIGGKTYAIPRVVPTAQSNDTYQIRGDLRKKYQLPEIKTIADFEKFLDAVKADDPTMLPVYGIDGLVREYASSYYTNGDFFASSFYIDVNEQPLKVKNLLASDAFEQVMNKAREWYKKGYLAKDPSSINGEFVKGTVAAAGSNVLRPTETIDALKSNVPEAEMEYVQFNSDKPKYIFSSTDNLLAVLSTSKHPKEAIQFVNWMRSSQENYDLFSLGVQDINYKADGNSASYEGIAPEKQYLPISWAWTDMRFAKFSKNITPDQLDVIKKWDENAVKTPLIGFSIDSEPVKNELAKVDAIRKEYVLSAAVGPVSSGMVDFSSVKEKMLKRVEEAGIDKILAEYQKQLDAYLAAQQ
ncbi:extracellular solute-binding protein [Cohnella sp. WQ 127256]|uniref:extracellular solute-binding protein n=1 Tax=Cohnella sp. WQ 127256 TaxID=2938790 RepID=UPI002118D424|nr:extracellular solute-binding protein [Cohnella sp. WQ 127256]